jgi:hypothetical protein
MGWWQTYRQRERANRTQIVERPVAAWVAHSIIFAVMAFVLLRLRGESVDWVTPLLVGPLVAAGLVLGTLFAQRREHRRSQKP